MGARRDLTGIRYARLVAVEVVGKRRNRPLWRLVCDCGGEAFGLAGELECGTPRSCGCLHRETAQAQGRANKTHGGWSNKERLYNVWAGMKARCYIPTEPAYPDYGGRGITICDEWHHSYETFREWAISSGYEESLTIDREDNSKGYGPDNCRWVDMLTQANNKRNNVFVEHDGKTMTIPQWAREVGVPASALRYRHGKGERGETLLRPSSKKNAT